MVFDNSGRVVRLEMSFKFMEVSAKGKVTSIYYTEDELKDFTVVDSLNVMNQDENYLKLLLLNIETGEYFTATLKQNPNYNYKSYTIKNTIKVKDKEELINIQ